MKKFFLLLLLVLLSSCSAQQSKINGVSFVGAPRAITSQEIAPVVRVHANWAAVMPFGFLKDLDSPTVVFNTKRQWWGERREGAKKTIELLNKKGIQVMLKPQIWVWQGEFTGNINMHSEENWKTFETSYENFIILYAKLAQELKVPVLCIGTELHTFVQTRPLFWKALIKNIKSIYDGKLTYAENWDQIDKVPFWSTMDYLGIDAYFPLSESKTPSIAALKKGWQKHKLHIMKLQKSIKKPVLFTEYGYRSIHYTAKEPWDSSRIEGNIDFEAQHNALTAIYEEFWPEPWFAGGFLWKWYHNHNEVGGKTDNRFTIQNKLAEKTIQSLYSTN
ncbi:glycoside hydrolase [Aquimarina sp. U1-2]|uniref:glycoside hydrolase family 113 n=1 Tax=Aquimarina sp. U1-2 TaxID=2823141 RepID=UPI001AEC8A25|nr:glycoside hydrolase [Aquimarina sp. U1-2]MBP2831771.1 glycoside hydrolase [Aquimarina sp. U1-2]